MIKPEEAAPDFIATTDSGEELRLSSLRGEKVILFGVCVGRNNYGRSYTGMARTTFVINEHGTVAEALNNVKVKGHAYAVLASV